MNDEAKNIVITGGTRGIGRGLAQEFLQRDCAVAICGRTASTLEKAVAELRTLAGSQRVYGRVCDVTSAGDLQALWDGAKSHLGRLDIWINNAGRGQPRTPLVEIDADTIQSVVETNVVGSLLGAQVALRGMLEQGWGAVYNVDGFGSTGRWRPGTTLYGSTKRAVRYLTDGLAKEVEGTRIIVGSVQPGMVMTAGVLAKLTPEDRADNRFIFNLVADRVENVTPWMADQILTNRQNGAHINYMSMGRMAGRLLRMPFRDRDIFDP